MKPFALIVLAAGKGKRMGRIRLNKASLPLAGKPIIAWGVGAALNAGCRPVVVVVGYYEKSIRKALSGAEVKFIKQPKLTGTGGATQVGIQQVPRSISEVFLFPGDRAILWSPEAIKRLVSFHRRGGAKVTVVTTEKEDPKKRGRVIRTKDGSLEAIREEVEATRVEKKIREVNTGIYVFDTAFLREFLSKIKRQPSGEYYLTDTVELANKAGLKVLAYKEGDDSLSVGVNTPEQLEDAEERIFKFHPLLFFDADNTLYRTREGAKLADMAAFVKLVRSKKKAAEVYRQWQDIVKGLKESPDPTKRSRIYSYQLIAKKLGLREAKEAYRVHQQEVLRRLKTNPGVAQALTFLTGYRKICYTEENREMAGKKLAKTELDGFFDLVVTSDDVGRMKPDKGYFTIGLKKFKRKPSETIAVGDNFERDLAPLAQMGGRVISFGKKDRRADGWFGRFKDLPKLIEELSTSG